MPPPALDVQQRAVGLRLFVRRWESAGLAASTPFDQFAPTYGALTKFLPLVRSSTKK